MTSEYASGTKMDCKGMVCRMVNTFHRIYSDPNLFKVGEYYGYLVSASSICAGGYAIATKNMPLLEESLRGFPAGLLLSASARWARKKLNANLEERALEVPAQNKISC